MNQNNNYAKQKLENRAKIDKYMINEHNGKVNFFPSYIQLEHTTRCNAECIMCNHFYLENRGAQDLSIKVIEKLKEIFPYCETLMLNGDGEPFLHKDILKYIDIYSNYGIKVGTNTNLCAMSNEIWNLLEKCITFLNISCDGATKETYELIRKRLNYNTFIDNLNKLNKFAPNIRKNLDCVIMKQNIKEIPDLVKFAADNDFASVRFHRLGVNPCIENEKDSDLYYINKTKEMLEIAENLAKERNIKIEVPSFKDCDEKRQIDLLNFSKEEMEKEVCLRQTNSKEKFKDLDLSIDYLSEKVEDKDFKEDIWKCNKICKWAIERCYIDLKGNVSTCCYNVKKTMGNLLDSNSFNDIWNGKNYVEFRKMMAKGYLPKWCKNCNWIKDF